MSKKEKLQKLIDSGNEFLGKNLTNGDSKFCGWNTSVIRFIEKEYGIDSTDAKRLKKRLYHPSAYVLGADNTSLFIKYFERDLSKTLEELKMIYDDIDENEHQEEKAENKNIPFSPTFNFNIDNSNTNTNTTYINLTFEKLKDEIVRDSNLSNQDKVEIMNRLDEIKEIQISAKSKKEKWKAIKTVLAFLLDKGADFVITYLPQILMILKAGGFLNG